MPHYGDKGSIADFWWERCKDSVLADKNFMCFTTSLGCSVIAITDLKIQKVDLAREPGLQDTLSTSIPSLFLTGKSFQHSAAFNCCRLAAGCNQSNGASATCNVWHITLLK